MPGSRIEIDVHLQEDGALASMAGEVAEGLRRTPKELPSKYFYDERGSKLFEKITELPEYYLTRTEQALLERLAPELASFASPAELIELGAGSAKKTRLLIDGARAVGRLRRYIPLEVSQAMARQAAERLASDYPDLGIHVVVGDYELHLDRIPDGSRRLVVFLGSSIGNFFRPQAVGFLKAVAELLDGESYFLLGTDLVKDKAVLDAAYNDSQGVTAEFNRNILRVINHHLDGDFDPEAFEHLAFYDERHVRIEMHLRSSRAQRVTLRAIDLQLSFEEGELMRTEVSHKYTRYSVATMLADAGLRLEHWVSDPKDYFALSLSSLA